MGNTLKCKVCEDNKIKDYNIEYSHCSTTELYIRPIKILGFEHIPKGNTKTKYYVCSNGHIIKTYEKCI
jgi:hypothetical protein